MLFSPTSDSNTLIKIHMNFPGWIGKFKEKNMTVFEPVFQSLQNEIRFKSTNGNSFKETAEVVHREKIIERQIIKVRCRYCGTLNNECQTKCDSCGAHL
jgi:hypothetical protein